MCDFYSPLSFPKYKLRHHYQVNRIMLKNNTTCHKREGTIFMIQRQRYNWHVITY